MRLIFLNRFYWPEEPATAQLLTDLAEALAARGHEVTVIASRGATEGQLPEEMHNGVRIRRVRGTRLGRRSLAGRVIDFTTFVAGAAWRLLGAVRKGDLVVVMTDPPLLGVAAWPVALLRGARLIHWVQDVFPEIAVALGSNPVTRGLAAALRPIRSFTWRYSAGCVAVSHDIAALIIKAGVPADKVTVIANWAPAGLEPPPAAAAAGLRRAWGLEGKFVVAYAGNLGRVHDLDPVLDVAALLRHEARLAFVFIGGGAQQASLAAAAAARGLANVQFHPAQARADLAATLAVGDVHLVTLRAGCETLVFPSKLYGIAAVARPVMFIGPRGCEVARIVEQCGFGLAFPRDEVAAIARAVQGLAAHPDRCAALAARAEEFSRAAGRVDHAVAAWSRLLAREAAC